MTSTPATPSLCGLVGPWAQLKAHPALFSLPPLVPDKFIHIHGFHSNLFAEVPLSPPSTDLLFLEKSLLPSQPVLVQ